MSIALDSELLRSFLAVARAGSVTHAAERLGRTQSAVSMQVRRLEDMLERPVFDRLPRGVALTEAGRQLLPYAERMEALLREAANRMAAQSLAGRLRIGIVDEYMAGFLPDLLARFAARHPEVAVSIHCDYSERQRLAIAAGRTDLAVLCDWDGTSGGEILSHDPTVWVTTERFAQHLRQPLPVALYLHSDWSRDHAARALDAMGVEWRLAFEGDNGAALAWALHSGLAIVPRSRSTIPEGCRELTEDEGFAPIDTNRAVMLRRVDGNSPVIEAFAAEIRAAFRPGMMARPGREDAADPSVPR